MDLNKVGPCTLHIANIQFGNENMGAMLGIFWWGFHVREQDGLWFQHGQHGSHVFVAKLDVA